MTHNFFMNNRVYKLHEIYFVDPSKVSNFNDECLNTFYVIKVRPFVTQGLTH